VEISTNSSPHFFFKSPVIETRVYNNKSCPRKSALSTLVRKYIKSAKHYVLNSNPCRQGWSRKRKGSNRKKGTMMLRNYITLSTNTIKRLNAQNSCLCLKLICPNLDKSIRHGGRWILFWYVSSRRFMTVFRVFPVLLLLLKKKPSSSTRLDAFLRRWNKVITVRCRNSWNNLPSYLQNYRMSRGFNSLILQVKVKW
jgi:hypothetical protein